MKMKEINKVFTAKVAEYIAKGYVINAPSMSGHQGEVCKVDLVNEEGLIRVWINNESDPWTDEAYYGRKMVVRVGTWNISLKELYDNTTVWFKDFTTIEEIVYYKVGEDWYVATKEEAMEMQKKKFSRSANRNYRWRDKRENVTTEKSVEIARKYLMRELGYQRVSRSDIVVAKNQVGKSRVYYTVSYRGHTFSLH